MSYSEELNLIKVLIKNTDILGGKTDIVVNTAFLKTLITELEERKENPLICVMWYPGADLELDSCGTCEPCQLQRKRTTCSHCGTGEYLEGRA